MLQKFLLYVGFGTRSLLIPSPRSANTNLRGRPGKRALTATSMTSCTSHILLLLVPATWCLGQTGYAGTIPAVCLILRYPSSENVILFLLSSSSSPLPPLLPFLLSSSSSWTEKRSFPLLSWSSTSLVGTHLEGSCLLTASLGSQDHRASYHSSAILNILSISLYSVTTVS